MEIFYTIIFVIGFIITLTLYIASKKEHRRIIETNKKEFIRKNFKDLNLYIGMDINEFIKKFDYLFEGDYNRKVYKEVYEYTFFVDGYHIYVTTVRPSKTSYERITRFWVWWEEE